MLRIGTRGHALALAQAEAVRRAIQQVITKRNFELVPVIEEAPARGVDDIREAIAAGKIDLGVYGAEDLPLRGMDLIALGAVTERLDPRVGLLTRRGSGFSSLQPAMRIGVCTRLQASQLLAMQRGFIPTPAVIDLEARTRDLTAGAFEALIVPMSDLKRLGRESRVAEILPVAQVMPSPGLGSLAVECRAGDRDMRAALAKIEESVSRRVFDAERAFLETLGAGDDPRAGAMAKIDGPMVRLRAVVLSPTGVQVLRDEEIGDDPSKVGRVLADRLLDAGAADLLR
ncbi:MAG: hypothetical protein ACRDJM_01995 [Actinomycetota bacterium]